MGFSVSTDKLPYFRNFERASEYERSVKPVRGKTIKPLRLDRRGHHMDIIRYGEGHDNECIACRLYGTACVTFYKDGRVLLLHDGYITQSTAKFINRVYYGGRVVQKGGNLIFMHGGGTYAIPKDGLVIGKEGQLTNVELFKVHKVNRAVLKQLRAQYKPFVQYLTNMIKVMGLELSREEWASFGSMNIYSNQSTALLTASAELEVWAELVPLWRRAATECAWNLEHRNYMYRVSLVKLKRRADEMILRKHRDTVFDEVTLPLGEYKKDPYKKYF